MKKTFGITGGGQLAMMLIPDLRKEHPGCYIIIYDREKEGCAHALADEVINGEYDDTAKLVEFAMRCNGGITTEFEMVPAGAFKIFEVHTAVFPRPNVIEIGQDRLKEKRMATELQIETPRYWNVTNHILQQWEAAKAFPLELQEVILKTRSGGYDGNKAWRISSVEQLRTVWEDPKDGAGGAPCIIESIVPFTFELSVIIGRNSRGVMKCYPAFQNTHKTVATPKGTATLLDTTTFPSKKITAAINERAQKIAVKIAQHVKLTGILAVEMFYIAETDEIVFNEMAPRPHNSGHGTRNTHDVSQFGMLARIMVHDEVPTPKAKSGGITKNIIGFEVHQYSEEYQEYNVLVTLYNKPPREGRKCGHTDSLLPLPPNAYGPMVVEAHQTA